MSVEDHRRIRLLLRQVGLVADVVLIFAILQAVGLRRMGSEAASRPA